MPRYENKFQAEADLVEALISNSNFISNSKIIDNAKKIIDACREA